MLGKTDEVIALLRRCPAGFCGPELQDKHGAYSHCEDAASQLAQLLRQDRRYRAFGMKFLPVRTLLSHRHNDVSDSKISRLAQTTPLRPVTVSVISLHFRKLVVRSLEVPHVFLLRDRSASRMANSFPQAKTHDPFEVCRGGAPRSAL